MPFARYIVPAGLAAQCRVDELADTWQPTASALTAYGRASVSARTVSVSQQSSLAVAGAAIELLVPLEHASRRPLATIATASQAATVQLAERALRAARLRPAMSRPRPTHLYHFTDIGHLGTIARDGLVANRRVGSRLLREAGLSGIKAQRDGRRVPLAPGGVVGDYVPFYFAPRSPMLSAIHHGRVPEYGSDTSGLVYLVTSVERLESLGVRMVFTNRNAALGTADFVDDVGALEAHVDWEVLRARYWANTADDPDRRERRMAECLVHREVPWEAFHQVATYDDGRRRAVAQLLASLDVQVSTVSERDWYF